MFISLRDGQVCVSIRIKLFSPRGTEVISVSSLWGKITNKKKRLIESINKILTRNRDC